MPSVTSTTQAVQDRYFPDMRCFGCGPANERGLRLKSYQADDGTFTADFEPWPEHDNGLGFLNGGIIATLLDCHSAAAVVHTAYQNGWEPLPGTSLPFVTAGLDLRYLRPAPLDQPVRLVSTIEAATEAEMTARVWLEWDAKPRSEATALWKRWRPRVVE